MPLVCVSDERDGIIAEARAVAADVTGDFVWSRVEAGCSNENWSLTRMNGPKLEGQHGHQLLFSLVLEEGRSCFLPNSKHEAKVVCPT